MVLEVGRLCEIENGICLSSSFVCSVSRVSMSMSNRSDVRNSGWQTVRCNWRKVACRKTSNPRLAQAPSSFMTGKHVTPFAKARAKFPSSPVPTTCIPGLPGLGPNTRRHDSTEHSTLHSTFAAPVSRFRRYRPSFEVVQITTPRKWSRL